MCVDPRRPAALERITRIHWGALILHIASIPRRHCRCPPPQLVQSQRSLLYCSARLSTSSLLAMNHRRWPPRGPPLAHASTVPATKPWSQTACEHGLVPRKLLAAVGRAGTKQGREQRKALASKNALHVLPGGHGAATRPSFYSTSQSDAAPGRWDEE